MAMLMPYDSTKPGTGVGAPAPLPSGGVQNQQLQQRAQQQVPYQGQFNGNPRGANNMQQRTQQGGNFQANQGFQGQGQAPAWQQQTNLGRYTPPTMGPGGPQNGGYNSNTWNNQGGMDYNLPGSYGSPLGQGQFAPMPGQFQQYLQQMMMTMQPQQQPSQQMGYMPPGKDGTPLRMGQPQPSFGRGGFSNPYDVQPPAPGYQPPAPRPEDMVPGSNMSPLEWRRQFGDPGMFDQEMNDLRQFQQMGRGRQRF